MISTMDSELENKSIFLMEFNSSTEGIWKFIFPPQASAAILDVWLPAM